MDAIYNIMCDINDERRNLHLDFFDSYVECLNSILNFCQKHDKKSKQKYINELKLLDSNKEFFTILTKTSELIKYYKSYFKNLKIRQNLVKKLELQKSIPEDQINDFITNDKTNFLSPEDIQILHMKILSNDDILMLGEYLDFECKIYRNIGGFISECVGFNRTKNEQNNFTKNLERFNARVHYYNTVSKNIIVFFDQIKTILIDNNNNNNNNCDDNSNIFNNNNNCDNNNNNFDNNSNNNNLNNNNNNSNNNCDDNYNDSDDILIAKLKHLSMWYDSISKNFYITDILTKTLDKPAPKPKVGYTVLYSTKFKTQFNK